MKMPQFCCMLHCAVFALLGMQAAFAGDAVFPRIGDRAGGTPVDFTELYYVSDEIPPSPPRIRIDAYFGNIPSPSAGYRAVGQNENLEDVSWEVRATAPAVSAAATVDVTIVRSDLNGVPFDTIDYPAAFTYLDAPNIISFTPDNRSITDDNRTMTIFGEAFPINRPLEVWFGDQQATDVVVLPHTNAIRSGTRVTCTPPPFPGGEYPLTVDLRFVTVGGGETVMPDAFTYREVLPVIQTVSRREFPSWTVFSRATLMQIRDYLYVTGMQVYFDEVRLDLFCEACNGGPGVGAYIPYHKPDLVDITVVNPDGGSYTLPDAFLFYRTSPYHTGDSDADGRLTLRELLRVVQFFNSSGYQCAPEGVETEDGYALGLPADAGAQECIPHDGDLGTQNWQVELTELLDVIQVYAFGQYEVCEDRYQFCPAAGEGELSTTDEHR